MKSQVEGVSVGGDDRAEKNGGPSTTPHIPGLDKAELYEEGV